MEHKIVRVTAVSGRHVCACGQEFVASGRYRTIDARLLIEKHIKDEGEK